MKRKLIIYVLLLLAIATQAQTARKFTINLTDDGKANMVVFLPENSSGKAIVGVPGGGYSMLSNTHEGRYHGILCRWTSGISYLYPLRF